MFGVTLCALDTPISCKASNMVTPETPYISLYYSSD